MPPLLLQTYIELRENLSWFEEYRELLAARNSLPSISLSPRPNQGTILEAIHALGAIHALYKRFGNETTLLTSISLIAGDSEYNASYQYILMNET